MQNINGKPADGARELNNGAQSTLSNEHLLKRARRETEHNTTNS